MILRCFDINWNVEQQDAADNLDRNYTEDEDKEYEQAIENKIKELKAGLPQEIYFTTNLGDTSIEEMAVNGTLADKLSDITDWLVEDFDYELLDDDVTFNLENVELHRLEKNEEDE